MTAAKLRLAVAAMGQKETKVVDLCSELSITGHRSYRHVAPDGTPRKDGLKASKPGSHGIARKRNSERHGLPRFPVHLLLGPHVDAFWTHLREKGFDPGIPRDASWGELYFHMLDPDGHELSFARPLQ
jgi:hypothetical protein